MFVSLKRLLTENAPALSLVAFFQLAIFVGPSAASQFTQGVSILEQQHAASVATSPNGTTSTLKPNQAYVAQERSGGGGGEGKPEDWDSPKRMNFGPTKYAVPVRSSFNELWPSLMYLLSWWL